MRAMRTRPKKARSRPSALVRAEHGGAPAHLTVPERQVFGEALRLGAEMSLVAFSQSRTRSRFYAHA
jgi:hypothetical protein